MKLTDDPCSVTVGEYRDESGRLVAGGDEYLQQTTRQALSAPLYSTPDFERKLPSMMDIYSTSRMQALRKTELNLEGYTGEEVLEWNFQGIGVSAK